MYLVIFFLIYLTRNNIKRGNIAAIYCKMSILQLRIKYRIIIEKKTTKLTDDTTTNGLVICQVDEDILI